MNALIILVLLVAMQQVPPNLSPTGAQENGTHPAANTQKRVVPEPKSSVGVSSPEGENQSYDKQKQSDAEYDRWLNHLYEWATVIGVVGGWVVLWFIWRQSNSVIRAERAWLMVELKAPEQYTDKIFIRPLVHERQYPDNTILTAINPIVVAKNQGKTPAWIFECKVWCDLIKFAESNRTPSFSNPPGNTDKGIMPVAAGAEVNLPVTVGLTGIAAAPDDVIRVYGYVRYTDIFRKKRRTDFGARIVGKSVMLPIDSSEFQKAN